MTNTRHEPNMTMRRDLRRRPQTSGHADIDIPETLVGARSDSLTAYLEAIGKVALLTPDAELAMARRVQAGSEAGARLVDLEGACGPDGVPQGDRRPLERLVTDGRKARTHLIEANLRLVVSVAKRYRQGGVPFEELVQAGNLGLIRAVDGFNSALGFRLSTYATPWVRKAVMAAIDHARTIRLPSHVVERIRKLSAVQRQLVQELGRQPTGEELALRSGMTVEKVREIEHINQEAMSLEHGLGEEDDFSLDAALEDQAVVAPAEAAGRTMLSEALREALSELSPREREVVRLRFGLDDGRARTLQEVANVVGLTREGIRQVETKALASLRSLMPYAARDCLDNG
jgi:RNA polymerase primary sigma factor